MEEVQYHDADGLLVAEADPAGIIEVVETDDETDVSVHGISFPNAPE